MMKNNKILLLFCMLGFTINLFSQQEGLDTDELRKRLVNNENQILSNALHAIFTEYLTSAKFTGNPKIEMKPEHFWLLYWSHKPLYLEKAAFLSCSWWRVSDALVTIELKAPESASKTTLKLCFRDYPGSIGFDVRGGSNLKNYLDGNRMTQGWYDERNEKLSIDLAIALAHKLGVPLVQASHSSPSLEKNPDQLPERIAIWQGYGFKKDDEGNFSLDVKSKQ